MVVNKLFPPPMHTYVYFPSAEVTNESEQLAEAGEIDASMAAVQQVERLNREHERLQKKYTEPDRYIMGEAS